MITEKIKRQLVWAFTDNGYVRADWLTSILEHERITLPPGELLALVNEVRERVQFDIRWAKLRERIDVESPKRIAALEAIPLDSPAPT